MNIIVIELSNVHGAICPLKSASPMLFPKLVIPLILCTIRPCFNSVPVLLVLFPVAIVLGPIHVDVNSLAMSFVIIPLSFVYIAI